ncbi:MAG: glycosyltransferase [Salibacteraceae bacterium]
MKIAFVHDWFTVPGGAEKVASHIIDLMQPSSVFALFNFMDFRIQQSITGGRGVKTSFLQQVPGAMEHYRYLAPFYPKAIAGIDVSGYNVIISSSWMAAKGVRKSADQIHISYCHTPMRFAWDLEETYLKKYGYHQGWKRKLMKFFIQRLKRWDIKSAQNVDFFIANSHFVAHRIERAYGKKSIVIYPPVDTKKFQLKEHKDDFYFVASRMVEYKNIDLILDAFQRLPTKQLVIAGTGPLKFHLQKRAPSNVRFVGWLSEGELVRYMQQAKAFINASVEDFGIAGLEAQACGTPVIALGKGGYRETVIENETGIFFEREHPEALADAILRFERLSFDPYKMRSNAKRYDKDVFRERFLNFFLDKCFDHEKSLV